MHEEAAAALEECSGHDPVEALQLAAADSALEHGTAEDASEAAAEGIVHTFEQNVEELAHSGYACGLEVELPTAFAGEVEVVERIDDL